MSTSPAIAVLAFFGVVACGLYVRTFIGFVTVREIRDNDSALVAVAWLTGLGCVITMIVVCTAIANLWIKP